MKSSWNKILLVISAIIGIIVLAVELLRVSQGMLPGQG